MIFLAICSAAAAIKLRFFLSLLKREYDNVILTFRDKYITDNEYLSIVYHEK